MSDDIRKRALALYRPPFRHEMGYIWDADGEMVADGKSVARVRGWGRISYLNDPDNLHDAVGELIAEALNDLWAKAAHPAPELGEGADNG